MNLPPLVVYGIGDATNLQIIFTILDPEIAIPLRKEKVYILIYTEEDFILTAGSLRRIKKEESEILLNIGIKMQGTIGIRRLWVTTKSITIQGDLEYLKSISGKMKEVMEEILGNLAFEEVPFGEMETAREVTRMLSV